MILRLLGTIESLHCGDGVIDDARFLGRDASGNVAVNADGGVAGLASGLIGFKFWVSETACDLKSQAR